MIDVKKLAEQASDKDKVPAFQNDFWTLTQSELQRFAALVLEAAAVKAENNCTSDWAPHACATAIRAMKPAKEQT